MPKKDPTYERIERALYKDKDESTTILSPREMEIKKRMMLCVSKKMEEPLIPDTELVNFLIVEEMQNRFPNHKPTGISV